MYTNPHAHSCAARHLPPANAFSTSMQVGFPGGFRANPTNNLSHGVGVVRSTFAPVFSLLPQQEQVQGLTQHQLLAAIRQQATIDAFRDVQLFKMHLRSFLSTILNHHFFNSFGLADPNINEIKCAISNYHTTTQVCALINSGYLNNEDISALNEAMVLREKFPTLINCEKLIDELLTKISSDKSKLSTFHDQYSMLQLNDLNDRLMSVISGLQSLQQNSQKNHQPLQLLYTLQAFILNNQKNMHTVVNTDTNTTALEALVNIVITLELALKSKSPV